MNKLIFSLTLLAITLASCDRNEVINETTIEHYNYSSEISQNRVLLAKAINEAINMNPDLAATIITECNKKIDGDKNVLCKNLFDIPLNHSQNIKIHTLINGSSQIKKTKSVTNSSNFANSIISKDSLVQIYYYLGDSDSTSTSYEGIVVIPEDVEENEKKDLLVVKNDGTTTFIRSDVDPNKNYLVISRNERANFDNLQNQIINTQKKNKEELVNGKTMRITKASFTSMDAKRTYESWWGGEPEVRLNIIYAFFDSRTNTFMELRNATFMYPKSWINNGTFKNKIKWNQSVVECPFWYQYESYYGRRLVWTEEDGDTKEKEINQEHIDPITNIKTVIKFKVPASDNDDLISDNWIDYFNTQPGEQRWGAIKFVLSFE